MFIDIPLYPFDEEEETFDLQNKKIISYNVDHIISVGVSKHPDLEKVWVLAFETTSKENPRIALAFPTEEEALEIKERIITADSRFVKDFEPVL